jgi:hypothetical protein
VFPDTLNTGFVVPDTLKTGSVRQLTGAGENRVRVMSGDADRFLERERGLVAVESATGWCRKVLLKPTVLNRVRALNERGR